MGLVLITIILGLGTMLIPKRQEPQKPLYEYLYNADTVSQDSIRIYLYEHEDFWFKHNT